MAQVILSVNTERVCSEREGEAPAEPKISVIRQIGSSGEWGSPGGSPSHWAHWAQFPNTLLLGKCVSRPMKALVSANMRAGV